LNKKYPAILAFILLALTFFVYCPKANAAVAENSWVNTTTAPIPPEGAEVVNGNIYVFTKECTFLYDLKADVWTQKPTMPNPASGFATAAVGNKIYIIGGYNPSDVEIGLNQVYDTVTDTWEMKSPMPTARQQMHANVVNGIIFVIGGRNGGMYSTVYVNEAYDPATDTWTTERPIPIAVVEYASAVIDNKIYVIGGQAEFNPTLDIGNNQIYDVNYNSWSEGAPITVDSWKVTAGATTGQNAPKAIYVMGGEGGFINPQTNNFAYFPENNSWIEAAALPFARMDNPIVNVNDKLYAVGGCTGWMEWTHSIDEYTPLGYTTPKVQSQTQEPQTIAIIAGVAIAASVVAATGITVYHFKHATIKTPQST
jgi:hypothetical protein